LVENGEVLFFVYQSQSSDRFRRITAHQRGYRAW